MPSRRRRRHRRVRLLKIAVAVLAVAAVVVAVLVISRNGNVSHGGQELTDSSFPTVPHPRPSVSGTAASAPTHSDVALYLDAAGKRRGRVGVADTGQAGYLFDPQPLHYQRGRIVHSNAGIRDRFSAGAVEYALHHTVTRIGLTVSWPHGAVGSTIVLTLPSGRWHGVNRPATGLHLVVEGDGVWTCSTLGKDESANRVYASSSADGQFGDSRDGKDHVVDIEVDRAHHSALITLPDGTTRTVQSPAIGPLTGRWAIFELFEFNNAGATSDPATLGKLWAS